MKSEVASLLVKVRANAWVLVLAPLLAVEDVMVIVGTVTSTVTEPRSPSAIVVEKSLSAASSMLPPLALIEDTDKSLEAVSPEATVVVNTRAVEPVPLT